MSFLAHFKELKVRLVYSIFFFLLSFCVSYYWSEEILRFALLPILKDDTTKMIYTSLPEAFFTYIQISMYTAMGLSMPFWMTQVYLFVAPGLYKNERVAVSILFVSFVIMFIIGSLILYYFILPRAIDFLLSYQYSKVLPVSLYAKISEYANMIIAMTIGFGLAFQLPIILIALCKVDIINHTQLVKFRRFAIVIVFTIAAIVTPPDIGSQITLALIMIILYEITILICKFLSSKKSNAT